MKLSSSTLCGCCSCCYCHCWLMMLLMVSSVVHVSPEMSTTTKNKKYTNLYNNNYVYQAKMTEFIQLNTKVPNKTSRTVATAKILATLPTPTPTPLPLLSQPQPTKATTTDNQYKQNNVNSYPTVKQDTITTVVTIQTESTISTSVVQSQAPAMTSIPARQQLQMTKQPTLYDTTSLTTAEPQANGRGNRQHEEEEGVSYKFDNSIEEEGTTSMSKTTESHAADNSNSVTPPTILRIGPQLKSFVQTVTIEDTNRQINDNSSRKNMKNTKNVTINVSSNPRQRHNESKSSNNSKSQNGESSNDLKNINSSKQKTANIFSLNYIYRYDTINDTKSMNLRTKASKQKQHQHLRQIRENGTTTALDAAQTATAINSLLSSSITDYTRSKTRSHNFRNHNSSSYNYIGTRTDSVSNLSPNEINSDGFYYLHKTAPTLDTTRNTTLQLRRPATYSPTSDHQHYHQQHYHNHRNYSYYDQFKRPALLHRHVRQAAAVEEQNEKCRMFIEGDPEKNELYSPEYPNDYPKNINCTRVIIAPKGQIIRLDFRNSFNIEEKEECKFDFLEIRDGQYGFSNLIGKYCGTDFPPEITSKERYLWLHFHSDESIEYSGFTAVYEFIDRNRDAPSTDLNCTIEKDGFEGFINATDVPKEIKDTVIRNKIPLDCMWRIQVQEKWKIQVKFVDFKLAKPNDCETNFLDIFAEQTVMPLRVKNFCGSAGEGITSESNILHMRFYAEQSAINSTFSILYTAFRERGSSSCAEDEYDCEDATCITGNLKCNGRSNCKFLWDEEGCEEEDEGQSEHMIIIITVFGLILGGMVVTFLVNCIRKIMHDQKIIREHIRQSKESKLNEMGRNSKARSRENISIVSPRQKHSQTSLQILDDVSNRYYREMELQTKSSFKEKDPSILRHDMIVQTSLCSTDDSSTTITDHQQQPTPPTGVSSNACDMGCQTRESLFATASLLRQKSKTPSTTDSHRTVEGVPPPPRFSTFGYDAAQIAPPPPPTVSTLSRRNMHLPQESLEMEQMPQPTAHTIMMVPHQQQQQQIQQHQHLHHRPLQEICHHHHQHQQHLQKQQQQKQTLPRHHIQQQQQQQPLQQQPQHHTHMQHHHHHTSSATIPPNVAQLPTPGTTVVTAISTGSSGRHRQQTISNAASKNKQTKVDESKVFADIRNSAPDVIIMTSH